METFWVMATVNGECCTKTHVRDALIKAESASAAVETFEKRLAGQGWEVGDCFVLRRTRAVRKWAMQ